MSKFVLAIFAAMYFSCSLLQAEEGGIVRQIKVLPDKVADCTSLKSICDTVTRGCKTNDEKAIALYNFMRLTHYHHAYPHERGGIGALKEINVYGWSLCGGLHTVQAALWRQMGWKWRYVGWSNPGHTTTEAFYDGKWHYFDVFLKFYCWKTDPNAPGGRYVASQADIKADPALVTKGLELNKGLKVYYFADNKYEIVNGKANWMAPAFLVCGDGAGGVVKGVNHNHDNGSPTKWGALKFDTNADYSTDINLGPGYILNLTWDRVEGAYSWGNRSKGPLHTCGDKDYRNSPSIGPILEPYAVTADGKTDTGKVRSWANGTLVFKPDFANDAFLKSLIAKENVKYADGVLVAADGTNSGTITFDMSGMPYVMIKGSCEGKGIEKGEVSVDGGKSFKPVDLRDFSAQVKGKYRCQLRLTFKRLASLKAETLFELNRCSLPYLSPGKNKVNVTVENAGALGANKLVVTYAYRKGSRYKSREQMADIGANVARAHYASWPNPVTVVRKEFTAKDLPATFEIDIPTPKGKFPVYPRMIFLRREIIAPGQKPSALPAGSIAPEVKANEELMSLPNPFLIGTTKAPKKIVRPTKTETMPLSISHAISASGKTEANHYVKTKKGETWAILIGGKLKNLPNVKDISEVRLVLPVVKTRSKAKTKIAAFALKVPFEAGKPYNYANIGDVMGTAILPPMPGKNDPPKEFKIDITRYIKKIASGRAKFNGIAINTIPDRGVDDGYIVRADFSKDAKTYIEIDILAEKK